MNDLDKALAAAERVAKLLSCGQMDIARREIEKIDTLGPLVQAYNQAHRESGKNGEKTQLFKALLELLGGVRAAPREEQGQAIAVYAETIRQTIGAAAESVGGKAATGGDDIGKLASTLAAVQMVAPDATEEADIARDESRTLQDRLEELFRRNRCFHGWSYTRLGAFCGKSRQAASDAIKKSEILRACRVREIDE
jgi:hypothetical protein